MTTYTFGGETSRTLPANHELEYYSDPSVGEDPFSITNGILNITASAAASGSNPYGLPYDSGVITTATSFAQEYGYFEINAELPAGQGFWPAFWMLPADGSYSSELDVFEQLGNDPSTIYSTVHDYQGPLSNLQVLSVPNSSTGFHTYGVDWEPNTITFYEDGKAIASAQTPASMQKPMYMLLNLAVGGNGSWPGAPASSSEFPNAFKVDWVHAYATANTTYVSGRSSIPAGSSASATAAANAAETPTTTAAVTTTTPTPAASTAPVTIGSGSDTLTLAIAEDAYQGNAQYTVSVDGAQIGGTQTAGALQSAGATQTVNVLGNFGAGTHTVSV